MNHFNICKPLEYDESDSSSELVDTILDPDFTIGYKENDEMDNILAFDSESENNYNDENTEQCHTETGHHIIEQSDSDDDISTYTGKKRLLNTQNWKRNVFLKK